ncbi:MAG TPA: tetratricopeptide repeat protein [Candidatus Acidoferrales bacterium]
MNNRFWRGRLAWAMLAIFIWLPLASAQDDDPAPLRELPPATSYTQPDPAKRAEAYYHFTLAHVYEELYEITNQSAYATQAIEEYKKALALDPGAPSIAVRLADIYARSQRIRDAVLEAQEILKRDPDNLAAHKLLARIYVRTLGNTEAGSASPETLRRAIEQYEAIVRIDGDDRDAMISLARLYGLSNQTEKAEAILKKVLGLDPTSEQALQQLSAIYIEQKRYDDAVKLLKEAAPQADSPLIYAALGRAYEQMKDTARAVEAFEKAIEADPANAEYRRSLGQLYLEEEKLDLALAQYQAALKVEPEDPQAYLRLSQIYRAQKKFDLAASALQQAKTLAPDSLEVLYNEASLEEDQGQFEKAILRLTELVASERNRVQRGGGGKDRLVLLLERLGFLYRQVEDYATAIHTFREAVAIAEGEEAVRARNLLADTLRLDRQIDQAVAEAQAAAAKFSDNRATAIMVGTLLGERGDTDQAVAELRKLLKGDATDREIHLSMGQVLERGKRYAEAEEAVRAAEKLAAKPQDQEYVFFLLGAIYERSKKYDLAEESFKKVLAINSKSAGTLNYLGYSWADRGVRLQEALSLIQKAVELEPFNGAYLDSLGWVYFRLHRLDLAEEYLRRAAARISRDPTIHVHLGDVYFKTGRMELAQREWERATEEWRRSLRPDFDAEEYARTDKKLTDLKHLLAKKRQVDVKKKPD